MVWKAGSWLKTWAMCASGRLVMRNRKGYGMSGRALAMARSNRHWTSGLLHSSRPSTTTRQGGREMALADFKRSNGTRSNSLIWILYVFVNISQCLAIWSSTKGASSLRWLTNCETSVGIKSPPLFLVESLRKKKKLAARPFFWNFSETDCASADFPAPAPPYNQKMLASSASLFFHSSITRIIRSRVDSAHRGGSKRAAELKAALGEQCFRSSSAIV